MSSTKQYIVAFDLDDVLCERHTTKTGVDKYYMCQPIQKMIDICNECYDNGCYVVIYTARGMNQFSGKIHDVYDKLFLLTKDQLKRWNIKHHQLVMGKIHFDLLIDDKAINSLIPNSYDDIVSVLEESNKNQ